MSTLSSKLDRIETELNSIRTVSGLEGKVLEEIPTGIETKLTDLNNTISERDAQITELNVTVETKDAQISSLNTTLIEKNSEIDGLNTEISEKNQTIEEQAATITEKETEITEKTAQITELNNTLSSKNQTILEQEETISAKNAELNDLAAEIARVNELLTTEQTNNQTLSTEIESLNTTITEKNNQIEELTTTNTSLTTEVEALTVSNSTLTDELAEANATIETLNARIAELEGNTEPELIQLSVALEDESGEEMFQETSFTCSITPTAANGYDYTNIQSESYFSDFPEAFEVGKTYTITIDNIDCSAEGCPQYELVDAAPKSVEVIDQGAGLCTVIFTVRKLEDAGTTEPAEPSTYQMDIAFNDSETGELLSDEYTISISLGDADGNPIGTYNCDGNGTIIEDLTPGTYNLVFSPITTENADLPVYNKPENTTATIVDSDIIVDVTCTKTETTGEEV